MHRDLSGEASLRRSMHRTVIKLAVTDARFGRVAASGEFVVEVFGDGRSYGSGVFVRFKNLMTDQSYLPEFIRGLGEPG